jgi:GNAT superfamily N-acetyltransferase
VHPDHRGGGLGRALLDRVEPHLAEVGAHRALGWSRDDEATVRFVEASGFERTSASTISVVDPRDVAPPEPPEGVELVPFSSFAGDPAAVHHVDAVSFRDEPGDVTFDNLPYEDWLERHWAHPGIDRDASAVALVDGVPAAITYLQTDRSTGRATNTGTGTLPEHRGRGLATLVKRASLTCAATLGIRAVYTGNDESNAAMLAVNGKLGYRPCSTMLNWVRVLDAEGSNPAGSARR